MAKSLKENKKDMGGFGGRKGRGMMSLHYNFKRNKYSQPKGTQDFLISLMNTQILSVLILLCLKFLQKVEEEVRNKIPNPC